MDPLQTTNTAPQPQLSDEEFIAALRKVLEQAGPTGGQTAVGAAALSGQPPAQAPAPAVQPAPQQNNSFGAILGALKAPTPDIRFTGGVSGMQLPYRTGITDMMSPFMAQLMQSRQQTSGLPSLGALLSQAPGVK